MTPHSVLTRRTVLAGLGSVAIAGCASRGATVGAAAQKVAVLHTSAGQIGIAVGTIAAPKNSAYFLKLVEDRSLVGHRFWRSGHFQGGDRRGLFVEGGMLDSYILGEESPIPPTIAATGLPTLEDWETTEQSGLKCVRGSVFFALDLLGDGRAVPDIVIAASDLPEFDKGGGKSPKNLGFPVFGTVTFGMDVVDRISGQPREGATPVTFMAGQVLTDPVTIEDVVLR